MRELHLFAGAGGGIFGGMLLGHTCVCAVEIEPYCRKVLLQRQRDGILPRFPIWDDVTTFDGKPWRGLVDVVCGGFPCQDISSAGKGAGIRGERSGLWAEFARIIGEIQPSFVWVENSPMLLRRGIGVVLGDLSNLGYDARWGVVSGEDAIWSAGTPCIDHLRARIWIDAFPNAASKRNRERKQGVSRFHECVSRTEEGATYVSGCGQTLPDAGLPLLEGWAARERNGGGGEQMSSALVKRMATPKAAVSGPDYARRNREGSGGDDLATQVGGQLNPNWVEWLMGWPIGWTDLKPLEMARFQQWLSSHGRH